MRRLALPLTIALGLLTGPSASTAAAAQPVVNVRTAPAEPGIVLTYEGRRYITDAHGRVSIPRAADVASGDVLARIAVGSRHLDENTIARFARWFTVGTSSVATFDIFRRVDWRFVDGNGAPIAPERVQRLVLRSTSGEVRVIGSELARPRWLYARRVSSVGGRLVLKDVGYAVQRVLVSGADVVNAGQQTFAPERERSMRFTLAFFTLTVRGEDVLFGSPVGSRVRIELPDGSTRQVALTHGHAVVPSLPRGAYRLTLRGGARPLAQPLVLSRSQVAVVPVVTYLDIAVVGGVLLVLAVGLVLVGRPYLARRAGERLAVHRRAPSAQGEQP